MYLKQDKIESEKSESLSEEEERLENWDENQERLLPPNPGKGVFQPVVSS